MELFLQMSFWETSAVPNTDWTVVFLRRLGIQENYDAFLTRANTYVKGAYDKNPSTGLSTNTPTEWHRLTMAVLAAGGDPDECGRT